MHSVIFYIIIANYSGNFLDYKITEQIKDLIPAFILAIANGTLLFIIYKALTLNSALTLSIQLLSSITFIILSCELIKFDAYLEIKNIIGSKIFRKV